MKEIVVVPIACVSSPVTEQTDENWGQTASRILLEPEYAGASSGLEGFSRTLIVTHLHEARYEREKHLQRQHRGLENLSKGGILSQREKDRPNPIGITAVKVPGVGHDWLEVQGLDAVNGTPVLDIKPYYPQYDRVKNPTVFEWVDTLVEKHF
jgi:tRNA-Thr(GGU) m(6)t(6)A37 methyltransferase TsaA